MTNRNVMRMVLANQTIFANLFQAHQVRRHRRFSGAVLHLQLCSARFRV